MVTNADAGVQAAAACRCQRRGNPVEAVVVEPTPEPEPDPTPEEPIEEQLRHERRNHH